MLGTNKRVLLLFEGATACAAGMDMSQAADLIDRLATAAGRGIGGDADLGDEGDGPGPQSRGQRLVERLPGSAVADPEMSTDELMALLRGDD